MKKSIGLCLTMLLIIATVGCQQEPARAPELTPDEASRIVGWPVPLPEYLPQGYVIKEARVEDETVILRISDEEIRNDNWKMKMDVSWHEVSLPAIKCSGDVVKVNQSEGCMFEREFGNELWWHWYIKPDRPEMFEFRLSAIKGISKEDIIKVAESVSLSLIPPPPGKSLLEAARVEYDTYVQLKTGGTKSIDVRLDTLKHGPGEVNYRIFSVAKEYSKDELPMPEGLAVTIEPVRFTAYPNEIYHSTMIIKATQELDSGEYWLCCVCDFENVFHSVGWIEVSID